MEEWGKSFAPRANSVVEDAATFRNELRDEYNKCFPQKKVRVRKIERTKPWLCDAELLGLMKRRDRLYARHLKQPGGLQLADLASLRSLSAEVTRQRKDLKRSHFAQKLNEAGGDSKKA